MWFKWTKLQKLREVLFINNALSKFIMVFGLFVIPCSFLSVIFILFWDKRSFIFPFRIQIHIILNDFFYFVLLFIRLSLKRKQHYHVPCSSVFSFICAVFLPDLGFSFELLFVIFLFFIDVKDLFLWFNVNTLQLAGTAILFICHCCIDMIAAIFTYWSWTQPFSQDYNLVSCTTHVVRII